MRSLQRLLRATHRWLAYLLGIQLLIWSVTGFYMVAVQLDFIHGDFLVRTSTIPLKPEAVLAVNDVASRFDDVTSVRLFRLPTFDQPLYEVSVGSGRKLLDAVSGADVMLSREHIEALAFRYYAGRGTVDRVALLEQLPTEVRGRATPLWRVDFDDAYKTSFYIDPINGTLVTRRHRWWRVFDIAWMLHIMDYGAERDDVNNQLLRWSAVFGLVFGVAGLGLLFWSFRRRARP